MTTVKPSGFLRQHAWSGYLLAASILLLWVWAFQQSLSQMVLFWYENEIFHHGFTVFPLAAWVLYSVDLRTLNWSVPGWVVYLLAAVVVVVWYIAYVTQIAALEQIAAIALLVTLFGIFFGGQALLSAWFPLSVLFFAVPVGEELIPYLQILTTQLATFLMPLAGMPFYSEGLYIHTSRGTFFVAEACSGVKFLVACVFFGYACMYLFFTSIKKRILYLAFCILLPLVANGLRVFITVLVGEIFGMEYVNGFDHIVYGWLLFVLVFMGQLFIALRYQEADAPIFRKRQGASHLSIHPRAAMGAVPVMFVLAMQIASECWLFASEDWTHYVNSCNDRADFVGDSRRWVRLGQCDVQPEIWVHFNGGRTREGELTGMPGQLVSALLGSDDERQIQNNVQVRHRLDRELDATTVELRNDQSQHYFTYWYQIGIKVSGTTWHAKAAQIDQVLSGHGRGGALVLLHWPSRPSEAALKSAIDLARKYLTAQIEAAHSADNYSG